MWRLLVDLTDKELVILPAGIIGDLDGRLKLTQLPQESLRLTSA